MAIGRLILLWLCVLLPVAGEGPAAFGRLPVRSFGLEQGLLSMFVSCVVQDGRGVLWAGTEAGLHRFDGHRWQPMPLALPHPMVLSLHPGMDGSLWIFTRAGLVRLKEGRIEAVPETVREGGFFDGLDARGRLWAHDPRRPLFEEAPGRLVPVPGWDGVDPITQVAVTPDAPEVVAVTTRRLLRHDASSRRWVAWEPLPVQPRGTLWTGGAWDGDGCFWLLGGGRLFCRSSQGTWREIHRAGGPFVTAQFLSLQRDREGWVWVASAQGLLRFRGTSEQTMAPREYEQTMGFVDREGSPWFYGYGILQVLGSGRWRISTRQDGLPQEAIWGMARDGQGDLYATTHGGLARLTSSGWHLVDPGHFVELLRGPDGTLYTAGRPGGRLLCIRQGRATWIPIPGAEREIESSLVVDAAGRVLVLSRNRKLWLGSWESGRWRWGSLPFPQGVDGPGMVDLVHTEDCQVFLAAGGKLNAWTGADWRPVEGVRPDHPWLASSDGRGRLVVGCLDSPVLTVHRRGADGVYRREGEIGLLSSEPPMALYALAHDPDGRLWVGTSRGLYQLAEDRILRREGPGEGIPHPDVAYHGLRFEGRNLWVATAGGIGRLLVQDVPVAPLPLPVLLEAHTGSRVLPLGDLRLGRSERAIEATFLVPSYRHPQTQRLEGRWPGLGGGWRPLPSGTVSMPSLPPGTHALELRAVRPGREPGPVLALTVRVLPSWREGPWLTVGLLMLVLVGGALAVRWRQHRLVAQNERLKAEVALRTREVERASQAKSAFLASMSHELRTPLNAVLLYGELLAEEARQRGDADLSQDLGRIHAAGRHLLALINGILDISKIEAGKMTLERATVHLPDLLQDVAVTVGPQADARGTRLHLDVSEDLALEGDELKLRQVLINLVGNAAKFTERGEIRLRAWTEGQRVLVQVADNGIGMAPEVLERIFQPFEQADARTERLYGGTGLGLTLSLKLVQLMGGRLDVDSALGKGTTFTVDLPRVGPPSTG